MAFSIKVNRSVDVDGGTPLLWVLCDVPGMTGTQFGRGATLCGGCTIHVDGMTTRSCVTPIESVGDNTITTIEAIGQTLQGKARQRRLAEGGAMRAKSDQIMSATALLTDTPRLEQTPVRWTHLNGVICSQNPNARAVSVSQVERKAL